MWFVEQKMRNFALVVLDEFLSTFTTLVLNVFFDVSFLNAFRLLLRFVSARETVHLYTETDEFDGLDGTSFGLHFSQNAAVARGVNGVVGMEIARVEQVYVFTHIPEKIGGFYLATQRVRVCE